MPASSCQYAVPKGVQSIDTIHQSTTQSSPLFKGTSAADIGNEEVISNYSTDSFFVDRRNYYANICTNDQSYL